MSKPSILSKEEFIKLSKNDQISLLKELRNKYRIDVIMNAWDLKYKSKYYALLRRLGIYKEVVNRHYIFLEDDPPIPAIYLARSAADTISTSSFTFQLSQSISGDDLSLILERLASFLRHDGTRYDVKLNLTHKKGE